MCHSVVAKREIVFTDHVLVNYEPHAVKHTLKICTSKSKMGAVELMTFSLSAEIGTGHIHTSLCR